MKVWCGVQGRREPEPDMAPPWRCRGERADPTHRHTRRPPPSMWGVKQEAVRVSEEQKEKGVVIVVVQEEAEEEEEAPCLLGC